jgi:putative NADH-flavin reductase
VKLLVFGASGPTGGHLVAQALEQGHEVTAFVRDPGKFAVGHPRLKVALGNAEDAAAVAEAVRGQGAVLSTLGRRKSLKSQDLIANSMRCIVPAMERHGVRRLILMSAFGVGDSRRDAPLLPRIMYRLMLRDIFADKLAGERLVRASRLEWTTVYPVLLTDGPRTGDYRVGERLELSGLPKISRADVAEFMLKELYDGAYLKRVVVISY